MAYLTGILFVLAVLSFTLVWVAVKRNYKGKAADFVAELMIVSGAGLVCCIGYWITFLLLKL